MTMISRRRLWSLAALAFGVGGATSVRAQGGGLPDCSRDETYGDFEISAYINGDGALSYDAALPVDHVRAPTRSGSVGVSALTYTAGQREELYVTVLSNDEEAAFAADEIGICEIFAGNARIAAVSFSPNEGVGDFSNPRGVLQRMLQADSVIRLTLGRSVNQWRVDGRQLGGALDRLAGIGSALQTAYANRQCQGVTGSCLLTTAACQTLGLGDDCFELRTVRRLRDGWLLHQPGGAAEIAWYYRTAPALLAAIPAVRHDRLFRRFYLARLAPAVLLERIGCHRLAFSWLKRGVLRLAKRYRPEALAGS